MTNLLKSSYRNNQPIKLRARSLTFLTQKRRARPFGKCSGGEARAVERGPKGYSLASCTDAR
jgi:hypothetical protein